MLERRLRVGRLDTLTEEIRGRPGSLALFTNWVGRALACAPCSAFYFLALQTESLCDGETRRSSIGAENQIICQYERLEAVRISAHARPHRPARLNSFLPDVRGPRSEALNRAALRA